MKIFEPVEPITPAELQPFLSWYFSRPLHAGALATWRASLAPDETHDLTENDNTD